LAKLQLIKPGTFLGDSVYTPCPEKGAAIFLPKSLQ